MTTSDKGIRNPLISLIFLLVISVIRGDSIASLGVKNLFKIKHLASGADLGGCLRKSFIINHLAFVFAPAKPWACLDARRCFKIIKKLSARWIFQVSIYYTNRFRVISQEFQQIGQTTGALGISLNTCDFLLTKSPRSHKDP